jgi:hypothetical protein
MAELRRRIEPALHMAQAGLPGRILGRLIEVRFLDRTVILAAQAFSAILPLVIVVTTISPHPGGDSPGAFLARRLGLTAEDVSSLQGAVDTTTPGGKLVFHVFAALAEFERDLIRERTAAGLAAARTRGPRGGRPSALSGHKLQVAREMYASGQYTMAVIAATLGVSRASIYRYVTGDAS